MDCGRVRSASAAAGPARAPARRADSLAKWAASHSSMQPKSCRFNRSLTKLPRRPIVYAQFLGFITECGESVDSTSYEALVGDALLSRIARTLKIHSIAPAAPSRCPVDDLVDDIDTLEAALPKSISTPPSSISSPTCVEVPCALM